MAVPKQRKTRSKTGMRRSHLVAKLRKMVNRRSPVKAVATPSKSRVGKVATKKPASKKTTKARTTKKVIDSKNKKPAASSAKTTKNKKPATKQ